MNHIALPTADPARGARFYRDVLGFREVKRPAFSFDGRWLYREEARVMIHLIHVANHQGQTGAINTMGHHFALQCNEIDSAHALLARMGHETVERTLPDHGFRQIFFRDPDGNVIEVGQWPDVHDMVAID